jgi:colicin import membrane protein
MLAPEPKLGRMLGASLVLHLVVVLVFTGMLLPQMKSDRRPVYIVDLVNLPVANPQAGRPDATPIQPKAKPQPAPEPAPKPVAKAQPKASAKPAPKPQPKSVAKPAVKAAPKTDYRDTVSAIEKLKRQKEIELLKQTLAGLETQDTRKAEVKAPLGEVTGTGTEAGPGYQSWLTQAYRNNWSLSQYQVNHPERLEIQVDVVYDARGFLKDYFVKKESGDRRFDDSVIRAIRAVERLEPPPGRELKETFTFNLKDLLD